MKWDFKECAEIHKTSFDRFQDYCIFLMLVLLRRTSFWPPSLVYISEPSHHGWINIIVKLFWLMWLLWLLGLLEFKKDSMPFGYKHTCNGRDRTGPPACLSPFSNMSWIRSCATKIWGVVNSVVISNLVPNKAWSNCKLSYWGALIKCYFYQLCEVICHIFYIIIVPFPLFLASGK